jgi:hypothetical protein
MSDALSGLALITATMSAWWAALAAMFAALSAFLTFRAQRDQFLESIRPELVLLHWGRSSAGRGDAAHEVVAFGTLKNVGRGSAFYVTINAHPEQYDRPIALMSTTRVEIIAVGEEVPLRGDILVWFKNVPLRAGLKVASVPVEVTFLDSRGNIYETVYRLTVLEDPDVVAAMDLIAPGVAVHRRSRMLRPLWRVRLLQVYRRPWYAAVNAWNRRRARQRGQA